MKYNGLMKRLYFLYLFFLCTLICHAQQLEIRPAFYSGLFNYRGSASTDYSFFSGGSDSNFDNPFLYGKKSGFSFVIESQVQWVSERKKIFGLGLGFEQVTSKATVSQDLLLRLTAISFQRGTVNLLSTNLEVYPYIGHRFSTGPVKLDALIGLEAAFNLYVHENDKVVTPFKANYQIKRQDHPLDLRPRAQVNALYKHIGVFTGYSMGLINLYRSIMVPFKDKKAYTAFFRLGISYQLK